MEYDRLFVLIPVLIVVIVVIMILKNKSKKAERVISVIGKKLEDCC